MSGDPRPAARLGRTLLRASLALAGLAAIVGSGGGVGFDWGFDCCNYEWSYPPVVIVLPPRATVQVGEPVSFEATVSSSSGGGSVSLQWCRRASAMSECIDIAGATGARLELAGANLADDGASFEVRATDAYGTGLGVASLAVSSAPPLRFEDGEFVLADWTAIAGPSTPGAAFLVAWEPTGGDPDAWRSVTLTLPASGGSLRAFHGRIGAVYDPAQQGAVYLVDFALSCLRASAIGSVQVPTARPTIEQGGRRFVPMPGGWSSTGGNCVGTWQPAWVAVGVRADEFAQVDGPPCSAGEACPDFSAQAAPIRFGFESALEVGSAGVPVTVVQGVDNWHIAVWRH